MNCESFFEAVDRRLAGHYADVSRTTTGGQCVVDFFHPQIAETFGTDGLVTRFNRSGIVWAPPGDRLRVKLRIPEAHDDAVVEALSDAPFPFVRTDHRGAATPDGEMVTILHYSIQGQDVSPEKLDGTLAAVAAALEV